MSYSRELKRLLKKHGCFFERQAKGSHEAWLTSEGKRIILPSNCKSKQMANIILKQANIKEKL